MDKLEELEQRIMKDAHDRWYISARNEKEGEICVDVSVANPGWEEYWVLIWVSPEIAKISMLSRGPGETFIEGAYEMTPDQLIEYLQTLPRQIQTFGAKDVYDQIPERG